MKRFLKILKRILIAILIIFLGLMAFGAILTKCGNSDVAAANTIDEIELLNDEVNLLSEDNYTWDFSTTDSQAYYASSFPIIPISNVDSFQYFINFNSTQTFSSITFEIFLSNAIQATRSFFVVFFKDGTNQMFPFGRVNSTYFTVSSRPDNILKLSFGSSINTSVDITLFAYSGSYSSINHHYFTVGKDIGYQNGVTVGKEEGYESGLEVGYQDGYDEGYNDAYQNGYDKGVDDTSKKYIEGIFSGAKAKFAYSNSQTISYSSMTDLDISISDNVSFSGFPQLTSNYNYYVVAIEFDELFHLSSNILTFIFNNQLPTVYNSVYQQTQVDGNYLNWHYWSSDTPPDSFTVFNGSGELLGASNLVPVPDTNYSYNISDQFLKAIADNGASANFRGIYVTLKLINNSKYPNPYENIQTLKFFNIYSDSANYLAGYNYGYNLGYDTGEDKGYTDGYQIGNKDGYDKGLKEGKAEGYANAIAEGMSQEGIFNGAIAFIKIFFQLTTQFLGTKIVGDITFGLIVIGLPAVGLIVNLVIGFIKKILGSRGSDE